MNEQWQKVSGRSPWAAASLPPAQVEETAWDVLLALHADARCSLGLDKLARLTSVAEPILHRWLDLLEERQLIAGARNRLTGELRPVLTHAGRTLLDRYLAVTSDLQVVPHH